MKKKKACYKKPGTTALTLLLFLAGLVPGCGPGSAAAENRVSLGYDSFIDRYTVLEDDTTESLNEYYINMTNRLTGKIGMINSSFRNSLKFGSQTLDERFRLSLDTGSLSSLAISLDTDFYLKHFREGSDYALSNNYRQVNSALKLGREISDNFRVRSRTRFEAVDYSEHTDFDYDYNYIDTGLEFDAGSILGNTVRAAASFGVSDSPDTTELGYSRSLLEASAFLGTFGSSSLDLTVSADRRDYRGDSRPSWLILSYSKLSFQRSERIKFSLTFDGESYIYDSTGQLYFNTHFIRAGAGISIEAWGNGEFSLQPRYARLICREYEEERYSEYSVIASYDFMHGAEYWVTLSYEPGYRNYSTEDIYSNFYINRLSLMGSMKIYGNISTDLFLMHDPERHSRRGDDFSITLISASLSVKF